ncbi:GNAT family N-acetyltransferase [Clostridium paridis]|uniref:GNAT family N-acetyltransferase n=1 Tax=Clostridium paridis TaxID=2803863 RepID=A0A937K3S5_9CLOT|nr:GNAT family N-acetyltransferase [Clostridium paridis]MBL4931917.1 GNAT family N-acetyltransferase [Clostridium paridis]
MNKLGVESERLKLIPLTIKELVYIEKKEYSKLQFNIEDALLDKTRIAIAKKIDKMKNINVNLHEWYTYWLIINKANKNGIGFIGFKGIPDEKGLSEVGYSISSNYRRFGYMTEALNMLLDWASGYSETTGITACKVLKTNIGSNKVLNKCNFKLTSATEEYNNYLYEFIR